MNKQFNYWTVIGEQQESNKFGKRVVVAKCRCGTIRSVLAQNLIASKSTSCGCYQRKVASEFARNYQKQLREKA